MKSDIKNYIYKIKGKKTLKYLLWKKTFVN